MSIDTNDGKIFKSSDVHNPQSSTPVISRPPIVLSSEIPRHKEKKPQFETLYLATLQIGERVELYRVFRNGHICVTKRSRIGDTGFVCPRFLREIDILKRLSNPPSHLEAHPGRQNIIKLIDVYTEDGYLHYDMESADGTLCDLKQKINPYMFKEQILIDVSNGLQYLHEMGFNHFDLSHSNIAYFDLTTNTNPINIRWSGPSDVNSKMFRFALMDFGNVVHRDRPLTLEISTYYTMPLEMIDAVSILGDLEKTLATHSRINSTIVTTSRSSASDSLPSLPVEASAHIEDQIASLRRCIIHKKSDIWSLGALSYYLHSYTYYADGESLDQQRAMILAKNKEHLNGLVGHQEIVSKTRVMLISDHRMRPVTYFSRIHKLTESQEAHTTLSQTIPAPGQILRQILRQISGSEYATVYASDDLSEHKISGPHSVDYHLYKIITCEIIDSMAVKNSKRFLLNVLDRGSLDNIIMHCYDLENNIMRTVIRQIRCDIRIGKIRSSIVNAVRVARIILLWLVSHLYVNQVWSVGEIAQYLVKMYTTSNTNKNIMRTLIINIATIILEIVDWNLEKYQK